MIRDTARPTSWLARRLGDEAAGPRAELIARARRGDPSVEPVVAHALRSHEASTREAACELAAQLATLRDAAPLLRALGVREPAVQSAAAAALARHAPSSPAVALALYAAVADADPAVHAHAHALAALAVVAPSEPVARALGALLVTDRYGVARSARALVAHAPERTLAAAAPGLASDAPFERRAALEVLHASGRALDAFDAGIVALGEPGTDTYVRRAAARALGHFARPTGVHVGLLRRMARDWDPGLRATAAVSLGQLATRREAIGEAYASSIARVDDDELPELATALRAAGPPVAPHGPLLARLARATGFTRVDLADAIVRPFRARRAARGVYLDGVALLAPHERLDDALDQLGAGEGAALLTELLALAEHPAPQVRATALVLAARIEAGVGVAMLLTRAAGGDRDAGVRLVARALLDTAGAGGPSGMR